MLLVLKIVSKLIATCCFYLVGQRTFYWTTKNKKRWVLFALFYTVAIAASCGGAQFTLMEDAAGTLAWMILCEGPIIDRLINILIIDYTLTLFQFLIVTFRLLFVGLGQDSTIFDLLINSAMLGVCLYITSQSDYQRGTEAFRGFSRKKRVFLLALILFSNLLAGVGSIVRELTGGNNATILFCGIVFAELLCIFTCFFWLLDETYQSKRFKEQAKLQQQVIASQKMYYQTVLEKEREFRAFRHDVGSQLGVLKFLFEQNRTDELEKQLNDILSRYESTSLRRISVGDEVIDAVLNTECERAVNKGIQFEVKGEIVDASKYDFYDLCTIFSNSVRNAIEACEEIPGEKRIFINIANHNGTLFYKIDNPATEDRYQHIDEGTTFKRDKGWHGYGVENIRHTVQRLKGQMNYKFQNGRVTLEIFF